MHLYDPQKPYAAITAFYALPLSEYHMHPHRHPRCEIMYITKGSCYVYAGQQEFCLKEQQFIFLQDEVNHQLLIPENHPCSLLNLEFSCQKENTGIDLSKLYQESPAFGKLCALPEAYFTGTDTGSLGYALKDLIAHLENNTDAIHSKDHAFLIRLLFFRALLELSKCAANQSKTAGAMVYLKKACTYIDAHLTEDIRIPLLAAYTGIHKSYLQALFSKYMHSTITSYITRKRLELAAFLLSNSALSITDIAFQSGYNTRQHFGSTFEKYYGMSPRSYRQLHGKCVDPSTGEDYYFIDEDGSWTNVPLKY